MKGKNSKSKKTKEENVCHDNSVSMSFTINNLTEKDVNKVINTFDSIQKDFRSNISQYFIRTSSNITKIKGTKPSINE